MKNWLLQAFDYDAWATRKWLIAIDALGRTDLSLPVLEHMVSAQTIWLRRVNAADVPEDGDIAKRIEALSQYWQAQVAAHDLDERITYRNLSGEPFERSFVEIALHVVNHGTYHRGHLRGLYNDADLSLVPNTDLVIYLAEKGSAK